ncbi:MAG: DUF948 domain-containing protein [Nodosilinea sp.]
MTDPLFWLALSLLFVVISLTAVLFVALPAFRELGRAARSAEKLFDTLGRELPPTLEAIRLTGLEITELTDDVSTGVQSAGRVVQQVDQSVTSARQQTQALKTGTQSLVAGAKAAWRAWRGNGSAAALKPRPQNRPAQRPVPPEPPPEPASSAAAATSLAELTLKAGLDAIPPAVVAPSDPPTPEGRNPAQLAPTDRPGVTDAQSWQAPRPATPAEERAALGNHTPEFPANPTPQPEPEPESQPSRTTDPWL